MKADNFFIQPFSIIFNRNDIHIMLYLENHPEYEAIEAMIQDGNNSSLIRVILTRHDQSQIDYINNEQMSDTKAMRETIFSEIKYVKLTDKGKPYINLQFRAINNENINLNFYSAGKPSTKYNGLINPREHSKKTSLPIMYRERSTLASPRSSVFFNNCEYKIPRKIWIPIFFTGMEGYYSEEFSLGVFRTVSQNLNLVKRPNGFSIGEVWKYHYGPLVKIYKIIEREGNNLIIEQNNERIYAEEVNGRLHVKEILLTSIRDYSKTGRFSLKFNPSLPILIDNDNEVDFSISIDLHKDLVSGTVRVFSEFDRIKYLLLPTKPGWAVSRPVQTTIKWTEGLVQMTSKIGAK
ncbi:MAG: hypothetical protein ACOYVD_02200 [Bacillota bacterium]